MTNIGKALTCLIVSVIVSGAVWAEDDSLGKSLINARFAALETRVGNLESENTALNGRVTVLETLLADVSRGTDPQTGQDTLQFSGMNVQIVNGEGSSKFDTVTNGTGNLIIGYNEPNTTGQPNERTGSHMLVVGFGQNYTSFGGIVAGVDNTTRRQWSSVLGGTENTAAGFISTISGGRNNTTERAFTWIGGGGFNRAAGFGATVTGGSHNTVFGTFSTILGGQSNSINGFYATIAGGEQNTVDGFGATVSGGFVNGSFNDYSTVGGGRFNTAAATGATVSGGSENFAGAEDASVSGGNRNEAVAIKSSVTGGQFKTAVSAACVAGDSVPNGGGC